MSENQNSITILNDIANFINNNVKLENNLIPVYETVKNIKIIEMYITKLEKDNKILLEKNLEIIEKYEKSNNEINNKIDKIIKHLKIEDE